jgi:histidyl-tRNA synthetase
MIDPRVASGTRDILPALAIQRNWMVERLRGTFERYGFVPIDSPILERREVLYAKGGEEVQRQVFEVVARGQSLAESELALRFDLTVPLARFMARHVDELGVPFKRYHIGLVYRGERAQRGRYREFYQCDFDTIGSRSALSDAEIGLVICDGLRAVGVSAFTLRINHRMVLNGMLDTLGLAQHSGHVLRSLDKLDKIGRDGVLRELQFGESSRDAGGPAAPTDPEPNRILPLDAASRILDFIESVAAGRPDQVLAGLNQSLGTNAIAREGIDTLRAVCDMLVAGGVPADAIILQIGLARGLDYYTGVIYETMITGHENYGSVCSGGRYDDLAGLFTERQLPGVGASFGLDRLTQLMADAGWLQSRATVAPVLVVNFQNSDWPRYVQLAAELRAAGIGSEIYPDSKPLRDQFGYASSRGHRVAVIAGPDELTTNTFALRDMSTRQQQKALPLNDLVAKVRAAIS